MSYGQLGMIEAFAGFFAYLVVMAENGFLPMRLLWIRKEWDSKAVPSVMDSYGQEWVSCIKKTINFFYLTHFTSIIGFDLFMSTFFII